MGTIYCGRMQRLNNAEPNTRVHKGWIGSKMETFKESARGLAVGAALAVTFAVSGCAAFPGQMTDGMLGGYVGSQIVYGEGIPYYSYREDVPYYGYGNALPYYSYRDDVPYYGYGGDDYTPSPVIPYYWGNGDDYFREQQPYYWQRNDDDGDGRMWQGEQRR